MSKRVAYVASCYSSHATGYRTQLFEQCQRAAVITRYAAELKLAARRRGEDIIDMSMGNPDGATPPHIVAKLTEVAQRPDTHGYSASKGIPRLRRAISHWYKDRYAVDINPDTEAIVTIGSKEGLAHLMLATLDRGDTVLVPDPSYPIHIYGAVIAGADIRSVPVAPDVDFFAELEKAIRGSYPKPKMMIFGFPLSSTTPVRPSSKQTAARSAQVSNTSLYRGITVTLFLRLSPHNPLHRSWKAFRTESAFRPSS